MGRLRMKMASCDGGCKKVYKNSSAQSQEDVFCYWWKTFEEKLMYANGENLLQFLLIQDQK